MDDGISVLKIETFPFIDDFDVKEIIQIGLNELRSVEQQEDQD